MRKTSNLAIASIDNQEYQRFIDGSTNSKVSLVYRHGCCTVPFLEDLELQRSVIFPKNSLKKVSPVLYFPQSLSMLTRLEHYYVMCFLGDRFR